jgi:hypothetical protein
LAGRGYHNATVGPRGSGAVHTTSVKLLVGRSQEKAMVHKCRVKAIDPTRMAFAIAVAAMGCIALSRSSQALPIAPIPAEVTTDLGIVVPAYYYRGRYYPYRWRGAYWRHRYYRYGRWRYY